MKKKLEKLEIGEVAGLDVSVPMLTYGQGSPKIAIVTGVHGDEKTGMWVIKELIQDLNVIKGSLTLINTANPLARSVDKRRDPVCSRDLNRVFPGKKDGNIAERLAYKLFELLKGYDLVIDLHAFPERLAPPSVGIWFNAGSKAVQKKSLHYINLFNASIIWCSFAVESESKKYEKTLDGSLLANGNVCFGVEFPDIERCNKQVIDLAVAGLKNILIEKGMIKGDRLKITKIETFKRKRYFADRSGLFIPFKKPLDKVKKGEVVGEFMNITDYKVSKIRSLKSGVILIISDNDIIRTGSELFSVGNQIDLKI